MTPTRPSVVPILDRREWTNPTRLFWVAQIGGWSVFGVAMFVIGVQEWTLGYAALHKMSLTVLGFGASLGLRVAYRALERARRSYWVTVAVAVPLSYWAAWTWMVLHHLVVNTVVAWQRGATGLDLRGFPDYNGAVYYSFLLLAWTAFYLAAKMYLGLLHERVRLAQSEATQQRARLQALRLQLNPHLIFNVLNGVSTLVAESRNGEANRMLGRLSRFLRLVLDQSEATEITLDQELSFARLYLEIELARFADRLRVEFDVAPDVGRLLVPPMILQPLVENAVLHGLLPREGGGAVTIRAVRDNGYLNLAVEDDGGGGAVASGGDRGLGLANTRERLRAMYGERGTLVLEDRPGGGTTVRLSMPANGAPSDP